MTGPSPSPSATPGPSASDATSVVLATSQADADAVAAVLAHHAQLRGRMAVLTGDVISAATATTEPRQVDARCEQARQALLGFTRGELMPHASAEEGTLYDAAAGVRTAELLVEAMRREHTLLAGLIDELASRSTAVTVAATAQALATLFGAHVEKENDLLLPLLAATPGVSVADLLGGMHELIGGAHEAEAAGSTSTAASSSGGCSCGGHDDDGVPELDVRTVPHAIRHATVFGAFDAIGPGGSLDLVAPHDPVPLLRQLHDRSGGGLDVAYLDRGPQAWRLRLTRA